VSESVKIQVKHEEKEYVAAARAFLLRDYGIFKSLSGTFIMAAYIFFWLVLMNVGAFVAAVPSLLVLSAYISALFFVGPKRRFRRDIKLREGFEVEFSDEGISYNAPDIVSRMSWEFYSRVIEAESVYVLVRGTMSITVIPKRAFISAAQEACFRRLLRRHFPPDALKNLKDAGARPEIEEYVPPPAPPDWR